MSGARRGDDDLRALFARLATARAGDGVSATRTPTQERIIRGALEVFAEEGFAGATTRAIAARVGVAEKTLFQVFGTKAGLFGEVIYPLLVETLGPKVFTSLRAVIERTPGDLVARLRAIAANRIGTVAAEPLLFKFLLQEVLLRAGFREPFVAHWREHIYPRIRDVIAGAMARGELRRLPPERVIRVVVSLVVGYLVTRHILLPGRAWNDDEELDGMLDLLFRGLRG